MALARCKECGQPKGRTKQYNDKPVMPVGYPSTAAICGSHLCNNPALLWLDAEDERAYEKGERIFTIPTGAAKLMATGRA